MAERYAIYYAPALDDPLWVAGSRWLGRDPLTGEPRPAERSEGAVVRRTARRYGFHATIKAPMRLAEGTEAAQLSAALVDFAANTSPVSIGPMIPNSARGALALVPRRNNIGLSLLAQAVVERFDRFRAPLSAAERSRRLGEGLDPSKADLLDRFGYPHVANHFAFHMTLTDKLPPEALIDAAAVARSHFGNLLEIELMFDRLVLFFEPAEGALFVRLQDFPFRGASGV